MRILLLILTIVLFIMSNVTTSQAVAEKEILKYKDNNALWAKHVCNVDLRPHQLLWMDQMDRWPRTDVEAPPRVGKTFAVEIHGLKTNATTPWEDYRIFAPASHQATDALKYHVETILESPILNEYIETRLGRRLINGGAYTFKNRSNAACYGQNSNLDGVNATIIRGEEFDDLDPEIWKDRILPRGLAVNRNGLPTRIRITGVIQGRENLFNITRDPNFQSLETIDIYSALALGVIDKDYVKVLRSSLTDDQWLRMALVKFVESRNFFWSKYIRGMQRGGQKFGLEPVIPVPGGVYESAGEVGVGLDMGAQGESSTSSKYSIQVVERLGQYRRWLYGEEFDPKLDPEVILSRIVEIWAFFNPNGGYGDAFDANLIARINDRLYDAALISFDRRRQHADHGADNWKHWILKPLRFAGAVKHNMFMGLQQSIHGGTFFSPLVVREDPKYLSLARLIAQLENIRSREGGAGYSLYGMIKKKVGDDTVDGLAMANHYLEFKLKERIAVEGTGSGVGLSAIVAEGVFNT